MMQPTLPDPRGLDHSFTVSALAGAGAIAAIYIYFLIFAGFAFLEFERQMLGDERSMLLMGVLGAGGVTGSGAAAFSFRPPIGTRQLAAGFIACAGAAVLTLISVDPVLAATAAWLVGCSVGWTGVVGALCLVPTMRLKKLGFWCGVGTGLAYAFCNQPQVFAAAPRTQILFALGTTAIGMGASFWMKSEPVEPSSSPDYHPVVAGLWIALFLVLVWLDSAAFYVIQHDPALKSATWEGASVLQGNAFVHLCAALLAGFALDRRWSVLNLSLAFILLMGSWLTLGAAHPLFPAARSFYAAGVSLYSTALVYFAARSGRPWLVGSLFAIAGWLGSAAGITMARSLNGVPLSFTGVAALVASGGLLARHVWVRRVGGTNGS